MSDDECNINIEGSSKNSNKANDNNNNNNNNNNKNNNNDAHDPTWIVALMDGRFRPTTGGHSHEGADGKTVGKIVSLKDPSTGVFRDYGIILHTDENWNETTSKGTFSSIVEFQDIPANFSAFLVGRHVVKDGSLYLLNRVDPLFFFLSAQEHHLQSEQPKMSWQPFSQCLEELPGLPREIHPAISQDQLQHICLTFENDELYYRFDVNKALQWLQRKQQRLQECLIRQNQFEQQRKARVYQSSSSDGVSSGPKRSFNLPKQKRHTNTGTPCIQRNDDNITDSSKENSNGNIIINPAVTISNARVEKKQSLQIICNYLTDAWAEKFVQHMGYSMDQIRRSNTPLEKQENESSFSTITPVAKDGYHIQKVAVESVGNNPIQNSTAAASKAAQEKRTTTSGETNRTVANKRLAKVNTKGMKSIASFFGQNASKPKKAKHN